MRFMNYLQCHLFLITLFAFIQLSCRKDLKEAIDGLVQNILVRKNTCFFINSFCFIFTSPCCILAIFAIITSVFICLVCIGSISFILKAYLQKCLQFYRVTKLFQHLMIVCTLRDQLLLSSYGKICILCLLWRKIRTYLTYCNIALNNAKFELFSARVFQ